MSLFDSKKCFRIAETKLNIIVINETITKIMFFDEISSNAKNIFCPPNTKIRDTCQISDFRNCIELER